MSTTKAVVMRSSSRHSSIRYDLRRRVLVSNLSRSVTPTFSTIPTERAPSPPKNILPSKHVPLDLLKDLPNDKRAKQQCTSTHILKRTPEKRKFRIDPSVLSFRNPIIHTPVKAPPKRRMSEPMKGTIALHLLRDDYTPPTKRERIERAFNFGSSHKTVRDENKVEKDLVIINPAIQETTTNVNNYDIPRRPVPLPRKSKTSRPNSASSATSTDTDPLYARIGNCITGSREDMVKYDQVRRPQTDTKSVSRNLPTDGDRRTRLIEDCTRNKRRNSLPINSNICLRPRFSSTSGECRAKKSLLFSDSVGTSKIESGITLKNIYAEKLPDANETPLRDTINRIRDSPEDRGTPKILNRSGIYSNNTLVVESKQLKREETDRSYGFTCRMRPALRALTETRSPGISLLPSKTAKKTSDDANSSIPKTGRKHEIPPTPPPRPAKLQEMVTPCKEIATQTSFVVHDADTCQPKNKKRRSSMEIFAEVSAKVKRQGSIMKRKLRRSIEITPVK